MNRWPNDADGDVFRSLQRQDFDFSKEYLIDFNIDFENELIPHDIFCTIKKSFPDAIIISHQDENPPYIQIQIETKVNYDLVIKMQYDLSMIAKPFGGWCDSWGVLH